MGVGRDLIRLGRRLEITRGNEVLVACQVIIRDRRFGRRCAGLGVEVGGWLPVGVGRVRMRRFLVSTGAGSVRMARCQSSTVAHWCSGTVSSVPANIPAASATSWAGSCPARTAASTRATRVGQSRSVTIRSATRSPRCSARIAVQVGRNRVPLTGGLVGGDRAEVRGEPPPQRGGGLLHRQRTPPGGRAQQVPDGEPGGFGEVQPADEHRPELVLGDGVDVRAVLGEDLQPPVGAVVPAAGHLQAPFDEVVVVLAERDPPGPVPRRPQILRADGVDGPPHREVDEQVPVQQVRDRPPGGVQAGPPPHLPGEFGDQVGDQLGAGGEIRCPHRGLGQGFGDVRDPGERAGALRMVPGGVEPVVQHRGQVLGGVQFPFRGGVGEPARRGRARRGRGRRGARAGSPTPAPSVTPGTACLRPGGDRVDPFLGRGRSWRRR